MRNPASYRRTALLLRPWITGKLYDDLTRPSILHMDAYIFILHGNEYLQLEWRVGGKELLALDTWLIEPDGLTPAWDVNRNAGVLTYNKNPALHARVIAQAREAERADRWARVSVQCHYIDVRERDTEIRDNKYAGRKPYAPRKTLPLPDIL